MNNSIIYSICVEDIQDQAQIYLGRHLTQDELKVFEDQLSDGLGETISPIFNEIFSGFQNE